MMALAALLLVSCAHPSDTSPGGTGGSTTTPVTAGPPVEASGTESPQPPGYGGGGGRGTVSLPNLPIGVTGNADQSVECMVIAWAGQSIPNGDTVTVTGVTVSSPYTKEPPASDCPDRPCDGYQFTPGNSSANCDVTIGLEGATLNPNGIDSKDGTITLDGQVSCPGASSCQSDATALRGSSGQISNTFTESYDPTGTPSPTSDTSSPTDTPSPTDSSTP